QTDYYLEHCAVYGVEQAISALMLPSKYSDVTHIISLYRALPEHVFVPSEQALAECVLPHMLEAFSVNLLASLGGQNKHSFRGVLDRFGKIIIAEEGFYSYMQEKGLGQQSTINIPLLTHLTDSTQLDLAGTTLDLHFQDGLIYVDAKKETLIDKLSARQVQVCRLIVKAFSNKEIAVYLNLKVPTVNNHVQNIFKVLKVTSRSSATAYLIRQEFK
ncbi:MAG: LuxR C-terminal-related transcriptional regulator, partial [Psychrosphaera sp.]|nr:LuxR C-terminal-related transcriptional regulator [Psychrosphaera sp.]